MVNKTVVTKKSVAAFLNTIEDDKRRKDCKEIAKLMKQATGQSGKMWGSSIVGFGLYHYKYASGREGDWFQVGFSPRKQNLSLYLMCGFEKNDALLAKLGKFKNGKGCLYIKSLEDINLAVLKKLISQSIAYLIKTYPAVK